MRKIVVVACVVLCVGLAGCSRMQQGAAIGAGLGAIPGAIVGSTNAEALEGAGVGAAIGAAVGAVAGDGWQQIETKKEMDNLKAQLDAKEKLLQASEADNDKLKAEVDALKKKIAELEAQLQARAKAAVTAPDGIEVRETDRGIECSIVGTVLFKSGSAKLTPAGRTAVVKLAGFVRTNYGGKKMLVEGHTDNQPIKRSHWKSNDDLGAARAETVKKFLAEKQGFDAASMQTASFGENRPVSSNDTKAGRAQNRRATVVVLK
jgi:chemotaxis protein MotB